MDESFRLIGETEDLRVGARTLGEGGAGIEVLVRLADPRRPFDIVAVKVTLDRLERLRSVGYHLTAQDGWWVVGEKTFTIGELAAESGRVLDVIGDDLLGMGLSAGPY